MRQSYEYLYRYLTGVLPGSTTPANPLAPIIATLQQLRTACSRL